MISSIYNNLLTSYRFNSLSRSKLHDKEELKDIYEHIIKLNTTSPVYLLRPTQATQQFVLDTKDAALTLQSSLANLTESGDTSFFRRLRPISAQPDKASVAIISDAQDNLPPAFSLQINSLATPQINLGTSVESDYATIEEGSYQFTVDVEENTYEFQFNIAPDTNNLTIQQKLSSFITDSNIGIRASVLIHGTQSQMRLESELTGFTGNRTFSFRDTSRPNNEKGLVAYFGLNSTSLEPQNASFLIDEQEKESMFNEFTLNHSLRVSLSATSEEAFSIGYEKDTESILQHIQPFIDHYNQLITLSQKNSSDNRRASFLANQLSGLIHTYQPQLNTCGIFQNADSSLLYMQDSIAQTAIQKDYMEQLFAADSPFVHALSDKLDAINLNPMDYVEQKVVAYPNLAQPAFRSPYMTSGYSGMFFNGYC